jgi:hypothetical protein
VGKRDEIELKLNQEGTGGLELKNGVKLFFEYVKDSHRLYIYTPLENIPHEDPRRLALYEGMLDCNFLNLGCETGALAIFRHTGQAVYQTGLDVASLDADRLHKAINALVDQREDVIFQLDQARTEIGKPAQAQGGAASTANRLAMHIRPR